VTESPYALLASPLPPPHADNSPWAGGIFYEGVMTTGFASSETDAAVMANIVAAGYA
jgi:hypothetical protein